MSSQSVTNKLDHRLVPRPYGYRRFADGSLNVTPIGGEVQLAQENLDSSRLLQLPSEIHNMIFGYVLGGQLMVFRHVEKSDGTYLEGVGPSEERQKLQGKSILGSDLLRVCHQLYRDTAALPFRLNAFLISELSVLNYDGVGISLLKQYQLQMIEELELCAKTYGHQVTIRGELLIDRYGRPVLNNFDLSTRLPNLKRIRVRSFGTFPEADYRKRIIGALILLWGDYEAVEECRVRFVNRPLQPGAMENLFPFPMHDEDINNGMYLTGYGRYKL